MDEFINPQATADSAAYRDRDAFEIEESSNPASEEPPPPPFNGRESRLVSVGDET